MCVLMGAYGMTAKGLMRNLENENGAHQDGLLQRARLHALREEGADDLGLQLGAQRLQTQGASQESQGRSAKQIANGNLGDNCG